MWPCISTGRVLVLCCPLHPLTPAAKLGAEKGGMCACICAHDNLLVIRPGGRPRLLVLLLVAVQTALAKACLWQQHLMMQHVAEPACVYVSVLRAWKYLVCLCASVHVCIRCMMCVAARLWINARLRSPALTNHGLSGSSAVLHPLGMCVQGCERNGAQAADCICQHTLWWAVAVMDTPAYVECWGSAGACAGRVGQIRVLHNSTSCPP